MEITIKYCAGIFISRMQQSGLDQTADNSPDHHSAKTALDEQVEHVGSIPNHEQKQKQYRADKTKCSNHNLPLILNESIRNHSIS